MEGRPPCRPQIQMSDSPHPARRHPAHHAPIERFNEPVVVQVNVCTQNRQPVLACDAIHRICREVWQSADFWHVGTYVIMPDHIHLFCSPGRISMPSLRQWVEYWKGQIAKRFSGGTTSVSSEEMKSAKTADTEVGPPDVFKLWQRDFWDTQMRSREHYDEKMAYVRLNPVRKGLANTREDWPYQGEVFPLAWR